MLRESEGIPPDLGGEGGIIKKTIRNKGSRRNCNESAWEYG